MEDKEKEEGEEKRKEEEKEEDEEKRNEEEREQVRELPLNRSPKGNTWSAIPVALLCMVVNWNERQGSGPKGDEVL